LIWELAGANNNVAQANWGTPGTTKNYFLVGSDSKAMDAGTLTSGAGTQAYSYMSPSSGAGAGTELDFGATGAGKFASIRSSLTNGDVGTVGDLIFSGGTGALTDYWRFTGATGAWAPVTSGVGSIGDSTHGVASVNVGGTSSGVITIAGQAAAGTYNFNLPATVGAGGQVLTSQGGAGSAMTWTTATASNSTNTIVARDGAGNIAVGNASAATFNGNALTPGTGTLTLGAGKTLTASNNVTFTATDGAPVAFGAGGTVLYSGGAGGTPSSITLTNGTGLPISTGVSGLGTNVAGALAATPNGLGGFVGYNGNLGTPVSGVATNLTGTASGLTAGHVTSNANLTGDVTSVGNATTLTNAPVIAKVLTGFVSGAGTISATDSILTAIQKINGNDALKAPIASPTFTGTVTIPNGSSLGTPTTLVATNATGTASGLTAGNVTTNANLTGDVTSVGNATTLTSAPVIAKVLTGYVSGAGTVSATDSILSAVQKLNGNDALKLPLAGGTMTGPIDRVSSSTTARSTSQAIDALANNGTTNVNTPATQPMSFVLVTNKTGAFGAVLFLRGTAADTQLVNDPAGQFSITSGTAGKTNIYASGGTYVLENKTGSTASYVVHYFAAL
jgi:hypothetical protein